MDESAERMMTVTVFTTKKGRDRFVPAGGETARHDEFDLQAIDGESVRSQPVAQFVQDCNALRRQQNIETRFNDPRDFFQNIERGEEDTGKPCIIAFHRGDILGAVLFGVIETTSPWEHRPLLARLTGLTTLRIPHWAFVHDGAPATLEAVADWLVGFMRHGHVDHVELMTVDRQSAWSRVVGERSARHCRQNAVPKVHWQTQMVDPATGKPIEHRSSKTRSDYRRRDKQLVKHFEEDVVVEVISTADRVDYFIDRASGIVDQTYQAALGVGVRADDQALRAYLRKLADEGVLRAYLLVAKGEALSYVLGDLQPSGVYYLWATSHLPQHRKLTPGIYLLRRMMELLIAEGAVVADFGWGESDYKRYLGSHVIDDADIRLYAPRLRPTLVYFAEASLTSARRFVKERLISKDVWDELRRRWRKRLVEKA
jgi:hypothetical protein